MSLGEQDILGRYRILEPIGHGAMGTVYKAIHESLHRVVAIKILRRDLVADQTQIERLKREAKLLADLEHKNIVRALDAGVSNGFPYLVLEYVDGETLRDRIARDGRQPVQGDGRARGVHGESVRRSVGDVADRLGRHRRSEAG